MALVLGCVAVFFVRTPALQDDGAGVATRFTPARAAAFAEALERRLPYLPGEVRVRFRPGLSIVGQARALMALRSRPTPESLEWSGNVALHRDEGEPDPFVMVRQLQARPEVLWAEPNYLRQPESVPSDPSYAPRQWNLSALNMPGAWDIQPEPGAGVVVAVIDTGVTAFSDTRLFPTWNGTEAVIVPVPFAASPDLPPARFVPGVDFAFFNVAPVLDMVGHGTHVASTIAQEANNGISGAGMAYRARIMPLKVCLGYWELQFIHSTLGRSGSLPPDTVGGCPSSATSAAIRYAADNGAKVINLSLSGADVSLDERDAIDYAIGKGVFVAAAVGNHFESGNAVHYPAGFARDMRGLVSVGAVGRGLRRSFYSATGSHVEVVAPGGDLREASNGGIYQATLTSADSEPGALLFPRFDRYSEEAYQGTSMATPHVAALAAMLVAQGITKPVDIEAVILRTARDLGTAGRDDEYGFGLIDPRAAIFGRGIRR